MHAPASETRLSKWGSVSGRAGWRQCVARIALLAMTVVLVAACERFQNRSPISPTDVVADPGLGIEVLAQWSPYVGIHVAGQALETYREAVSVLRGAGRLKGVRVEITRGLSPGDPTLRAITGTGVEVLGLISNEMLRLPNVEDEINRIFRAYPQIRHFQIGNEVTSILPPTGPTLNITQYMSVFQRIYDHVQNHYRNRVTLLPQSPLGTGTQGPMELESMVANGLAEMNPDNIIIAINAYDLDSAVRYLGLLGGSLRKYRVWVTESGVRNPDLHISWVRDNYPQLRNLLRAERVYWYTMWGGDNGQDTDVSLVKNPGHYPNYWKSPLFQVLTASP